MPLPRSSVDVDGITYAFRSLSHSEAVHMREGTATDPLAGQAYMLSKALDISEDAAREFMDDHSFGVVDALEDAILVFSGVTTRARIDAIKAKAMGLDALPVSESAADPKPDGPASS